MITKNCPKVANRSPGPRSGPQKKIPLSTNAIKKGLNQPLRFERQTSSAKVDLEPRIYYVISDQKTTKNYDVKGTSDFSHDLMIGDHVINPGFKVYFRGTLNSQRFSLDESTREREKLSAKAAKKKVQHQNLQNDIETLRTEAQELAKTRIELQSLQQEHSQTVREMRQTKQKLLKTESDLKSASSSTQRQQSEQIKEMTRNLRQVQR
jgi:hypothetical protein